MTTKARLKSTKQRHIAYFAVTLLIGLGMAFRPDYVGNVGFLILGASIALFSVILVDEYKQEARIAALARALYQELANRAARCCFDFEKPWENWIDEKNCRDREVSVVRMLGFTPLSPIVYPATAAQISSLNDDAQQTLLTFYAALAAYEKDIAHIADFCQRTHIEHVPTNFICRLAGRLARTLPPAYEALTRLGAMVDNPEIIDAEAIRYADTLFDHERSHLPLRKRIEHYLPTHRRKAASEIWHFCTNCSEWPIDDYVQSIDRPVARLLCEECKTKVKQKACNLMKSPSP